MTTLLAPFFAIIRSPLSTGPITSAALSALHSFFLCELISSNAAGLEHALVELSTTVSRCKFEASDSSGDEVVLLKIMTVIQNCMCGGVGDTLGDIEVCEMLETVLTTCCQMRLSGTSRSHRASLVYSCIRSEILRRSAEATMHALVRTVFHRLQFLDPEKEEQKLAEASNDMPESEVKMSVSTDHVDDTNSPITPSTATQQEVDHPEVKHDPPITPTIESAPDLTKVPCKCLVVCRSFSNLTFSRRTSIYH